MFTSFDSIVDTVQGAQTKFVETFVTDKKVQAEVVKLVEAQAKFTKTTYKNTLEAAENTVKYFNDSVKEFSSKKAGV
jgi:hypothetical protein